MQKLNDTVSRMGDVVEKNINLQSTLIMDLNFK